MVKTGKRRLGSNIWVKCPNQGTDTDNTIV